MERSNEPTGWTGFAYFAAVMLVLIGSFNIFYGLVALFKDEFLQATRAGLVVWDATQWGWITLILGAVQILVGFAIMSGATWGRVFGVIFAGVNAFGQLAFLPAYPIWSTIIIALDVFVIFALTAHGRELRE